MQAASIPAAFLNSTLNPQEQAAIKKQAEEGRFYLLYISPERLVREDTIAWLRKVPVGYFAVDEAHCISEWGHEFRPEYRRLRMLRDLFPTSPSLPSRPARPGRCGTISWLSSGCANPLNLPSVFSARTCAMRYASAGPTSSSGICWRLFAHMRGVT